MIRVTLKGLLARKLRLALTSLAIVLGVGMVTGTFSLTDTVNAGVHDIIGGAYAKADAVVSAKAVFGGGDVNSFPESTLGRIRGLHDVRSAGGGALHRAGVAAVIAGERSGDGRIFGSTVQVAGIDPGLSQLLRLRWTAGSDAAMAQLGAAGAIVDKSFARSHHPAVGSPLHLETSTGKMLALRVTAINDSPTSEDPRSARSRSRRAPSTRPTRTSPPRTRARSTTWSPAFRTPRCRARPSS